MKASKSTKRQEKAVFLLTRSLRKQSTESLQIIVNICQMILKERSKQDDN